MAVTRPATRNQRPAAMVLLLGAYIVSTTLANVAIIDADRHATLWVHGNVLIDAAADPIVKASDILRWDVAPLCIASDEFAAAQHPRGMQFWEYLNRTSRGVYTYARIHNVFTSAAGDRRGAANAGGDVVQRHDNGTTWYNWTIVDRVYDAIVSAGITPFVEIGFMPVLLSSNPGEAPERREPADYSEWTALVGAFVNRLADRHGLDAVATWRFEVWNEPDAGSFWRDGIEGYLRLYNETARAVKAESASLKVGGPAVASNPDFLRAFLARCLADGMPLDFISFHAKGGTGEADHPSHARLAGQVTASLDVIDEFPPFRQRDGSDIEYFLTEADPIVGSHVSKEANPVFEFRDREYYPAWYVNTLATLARIQVARGVSIHGVFSHNILFPWEVATFHGTRGFVTPLFLAGTPAPVDIPAAMPLPAADAVIGKPIHLAAQLVARIPRNASFMVNATLSGVPAARGFVNALAFKGQDGTVRILIAHQEEQRHATTTRQLRVEINVASLLGPGASTVTAREWRIDRERNNPFRAWEGMGSPARVTPAQVALLDAAATLSPTGVAVHGVVAGSLRLDVSLQPYTTMLLELDAA